MRIAVTGYYGTGSSAVIDLLLEYKECSEGILNRYEHLPFYTPNGLFDLEDKLLIGNNLHRSDEALSSFRDAMNRLNQYNFGWFGGYKKRYGNEFADIVDEFLGNIEQFQVQGNWSYNYTKMRMSFLSSVKDIVKIIMRKPLCKDFGEKAVYNKKNIIKSSFITSDDFYKYAREFVQNYFNMISDKSDFLILDHLVLPHNLFRIKNYFGDDFRVIVVDRDVRDVYTLSKYVWPVIGASSPLPTDVNEFLRFWKSMREIEQQVDDDRILRLQLEDLIYKYDETVEKIEKFLGLSTKDHEYIKKRMIPEKSIKNTQSFTMQPEWEKEVEILEKELPSYIYPFPYRIKSSIKEMFD